MLLGKYKVVQPLVHLQWTYEFTRDLAEFIVTNSTQQPAKCLSARAVLKDSHQWRREVQSRGILQSIQSSQARRHLLTPRDQFEYTDEKGTWECVVYDETIGPDLAWAVSMKGPEDTVWPASLVRRIAKQTLGALSDLRQSSAVLGIQRSSMRLVYPSLHSVDPSKIHDFYHFDDDGWAELNDTCTGPEGSLYNPDVIQIKLDQVGEDPPLSCSPEVVLLNQKTPASDMFAFGTVLFDLAAGLIYDIEAEPTIRGSPSFTEGLVRSQAYLGKLPSEYLEALEPESSQINVRAAEEPVEAIYKRLHSSLETRTEDRSVATENDRWTEEDLRKLADLLSRMMDYNPQTRITPEDALQHPFFNS